MDIAYAQTTQERKREGEAFRDNETRKNMIGYVEIAI